MAKNNEKYFFGEDIRLRYKYYRMLELSEALEKCLKPTFWGKWPNRNTVDNLTSLKAEASADFWISIQNKFPALKGKPLKFGGAFEIITY